MSKAPSPPHPGASPSATTKRLLLELRDYASSPNEALLHLAPVRDDELMKWEAVLKGPPGSAYEAGLWHLTLLIPPTYPLAPPTISFDTPVCHPNIHFGTGEICLSLLTPTHWTPAYTLSASLGAVQQLLVDPDASSPLNVDVANLLRDGDKVGAEGLVRFYCGELRWEGDVGRYGGGGAGMPGGLGR